MHINDVEGCCAVKEIAYISECPNSKSIIEEILGDAVSGDTKTYESYRKTNPSLAKYYKPKLEPLPGIFIFTEVVRGDHSSGVYGRNLAAYIRRHKLGTVKVGVTAPNRENHPTHVVRIYTWAPNQEALTKWALKNGLFDPDYESPQSRNSRW